MHKEENKEKENKRQMQVQLSKGILKTGKCLFICFYCHSHCSYITLSHLGTTSHCSKLCSNLCWWHWFQKDLKLFLKHLCG